MYIHVHTLYTLYTCRYTNKPKKTIKMFIFQFSQGNTHYSAVSLSNIHSNYREKGQGVERMLPSLSPCQPTQRWQCKVLLRAT